MLKEIHLQLDADGKVSVFGLGHSPWESTEQAAALERLIVLLEHAGHGPGHRVPEAGAPSLPGAWSECAYCHPRSLPLASAAGPGPAFLHRCGYEFTEQGGYPTTREDGARFCPQCGLPVSLPRWMTLRLDERGPRRRKPKRSTT
jgi:hypothetical protein